MTNKGVSVYLALMIMFILMGIALGLNNILFIQSKTIGGMGNSVLAFYAADSGIEKALYEDYRCWQEGCFEIYCVMDCKGLKDGSEFSAYLNNDSSYKTEFFTDGVTITIKSVGTYRDTNRAIEVTR